MLLCITPCISAATPEARTSRVCPSSQKQRSGHITTINHTSVLSENTGESLRETAILERRERGRESGRVSTNLLAPSRQAPGSGYLINYSNASFPFPLLPDITGRHRVFTRMRETMADLIAKAVRGDDVGAILRLYYVFIGIDGGPAR